MPQCASRSARGKFTQSKLLARETAPDRHHLDSAHEWIVQIYKAWGKPERAAERRQR